MVLQRGLEPRRACRFATGFAALSASLKNASRLVSVGSSPFRHKKRRPPLRGDLLFWCSSGDSNPGEPVALRPASPLFPLRSKTLRVWCPWVRALSGIKKEDRPFGVIFFFGAPAGTRTPDTLLKRQVLYLLSYWGIGKKRRALPQIKTQRSGFDLEKEEGTYGYAVFAARRKRNGVSFF